MTFGSVFGGIMGQSSPQYYDHYPASGESPAFVSERDGGGTSYIYGHTIKKYKKKSKDKKQAAMSALTLLAFLFFLNILQNCLKEKADETNTNAAIMMMVPTPTQQVQRDPLEDEQLELIRNTENHIRQKKNVRSRDADEKVQADIKELSEDSGKERGKTPKDFIRRTSRALLQFDEKVEEAPVAPKRTRQTKFIQNYEDVNDNWAEELSQISDRDIEHQRVKTEGLHYFWRNNKLITGNMENQGLKTETLPKIKVNKLIKSPMSSDIPSNAPKYRKYKKKEKTTTTTEASEIKAVEFETEKIEVADFRDFNNVPTESPPKEEENDIATDPPTPSKRPDIYHLRKELIANYVRPQDTTENVHIEKEYIGRYNHRMEYLKQDLNEDTPNVFQEQNGIVNTPRNRRSDFASTTHSSEVEETNQINEKVQVDPQVVTPSIGLDLNTYKTYPVYSNPAQIHYNHRYTAQPYKENNTFEGVTPEETAQTQGYETNHLQTESISLTTTEAPTYYPVYSTKLHQKPSYYDQMKWRNRYPNHNAYYQMRNRYPIDTRYRYSPYRKTSSYDPGYHHHEEYYPMSSVGKYPGTHDEEIGFNLIKFVWTMLTAFARPLARLVPSFAKVGNGEPQCYDLLVCEAHRVSKYVGPTAEAMASTFSTVLTWVTAEDHRQSVIEAVNSGKENTCQQQIQACDDRSGGKSAMTVIAQVMEMKMR